jgi:hypothetical protein
MKRTVLALLLTLLGSAALAQSNEGNLGWNIAASSDSVWDTDHNFVSPAL